MSRRGRPGLPVTVPRALRYLDNAEQHLRLCLRHRREATWRKDRGMRLLIRFMIRCECRRVRFWRSRLAGARRRAGDIA